LDFRSEVEVCQSPIPLEEYGGDAYAPPWTYPTSEAVTVGDMTDKKDEFGFVKEDGGSCMCQDENYNN
jgi:hypothetical protein